MSPSSLSLALLTLSVSFVASGCLAPTEVAGASRFSWRQVEPRAVTALDVDEVRLFELRHGPLEDEPALHPVGLLGEDSLTWDRPPDHAWHHGIWFAWKYIDGVNYWEHGPEGRPVGETTWGEPQFEIRADGSARVLMELAYGHAEPGDLEDAAVPEARLRERRELVIHPPAADGTWVMDWSSSFEAQSAAVALDRTPLLGEPGGVVYGGYGGLSLRLAQLADRQVTNLDGSVAFIADSRARPQGEALDYAGRTDADAALAGIAVFEHPDNPRSPRSWYVIRLDTMTFFSPAVLTEGPLVVEPGEQLRLAWRIAVHAGAWTPDRLLSEREKYLASLAP
jgi:hypothetical protein